MGLTACGAYPDPIGAVAHKKGQASVTTLANRGPLPFRRFSTARCAEITSAFYSFVVISHMIRQATRLAADSLPPLFPCQLSSKSFRPKLLRTLFALSHATARSKPCVFSCLRTLCRRNGRVGGLPRISLEPALVLPCFAVDRYAVTPKVDRCAVTYKYKYDQAHWRALERPRVELRGPGGQRGGGWHPERRNRHCHQQSRRRAGDRAGQ